MRVAWPSGEPYLTNALLPAALETSQLDDNSLPLIARTLSQTADQDFGRTGQARHRIEIARIEKQHRRSELVDGTKGGAAVEGRALILGEAPAGIERSP